jgi:phage gp36-like protein
MAYCTINDIYNKFGQPNVERWINQEEDGTIDTTIIDEAINQATGTIESSLRRSDYIIPFQFLDTASAAVVRDWCTIFAAYWLYTSRGFLDQEDDNKFQTLRENAIDEINQYKEGTRYLNAQTFGETSNEIFVLGT